MGRNERAVARKNAAARRRGGRLQCYRTVERGIAESRDGGKDEGEERREECARDRDGAKLEEERRTEQENECTTALRGVCVAWVETAPRSPTGRIIIPTHTYVHSGARSGA